MWFYDTETTNVQLQSWMALPGIQSQFSTSPDVRTQGRFWKSDPHVHCSFVDQNTLSLRILNCFTFMPVIICLFTPVDCAFVDSAGFYLSTLLRDCHFDLLITCTSLSLQMPFNACVLDRESVSTKIFLFLVHAWKLLNVFY